MPGPDSEPDYQLEIMIDGTDHVLAVKPPVEFDFREKAYDLLDSMGLIKAIVVRGGNFFETQHLPDSSPYSELRVSSTALTVASQSIVKIAHQSADILRSQGKTASVSPDLIARGGTRTLFQTSTRHP